MAQATGGTFGRGRAVLLADGPVSASMVREQARRSRRRFWHGRRRGAGIDLRRVWHRGRLALLDRARRRGTESGEESGHRLESPGAGLAWQVRTVDGPRETRRVAVDQPRRAAPDGARRG